MPISSLSSKSEPRKIVGPHYLNSGYNKSPQAVNAVNGPSPNAPTYQNRPNPASWTQAKNASAPQTGYPAGIGGQRSAETLAKNAGVRMGPSVVNPNPQAQGSPFSNVAAQVSKAPRAGQFGSVANVVAGRQANPVAMQTQQTPQTQNPAQVNPAAATPVQSSQFAPVAGLLSGQRTQQVGGNMFSSPGQSPFYEQQQEIQRESEQNQANQEVADARKAVNADFGDNSGDYAGIADAWKNQQDKGYKDAVDLGQVRDVQSWMPYDDELNAAFKGISTDIANQQAHGLSVIEQQKQKAINDLAGVLGTRGMGSSYATMLSGLGGLESAAMQQGADLSSSLEKQRVEQELAKAQQMTNAAEVEGGLDIKAQTANQAKDVQVNNQSLDQNDQQFEQAKAVNESIWANIENMKTAMDIENMTGEEKDEFDAALSQMTEAQQSGQYTPEELMQLYFSLFGRWVQYAQTNN